MPSLRGKGSVAALTRRMAMTLITSIVIRRGGGGRCCWAWSLPRWSTMTARLSELPLGLPIRGRPSGNRRLRSLQSLSTPTGIGSDERRSVPKGSYPDSPYEELQWVSAEIRKHDALYYNGQPELDDAAYDALTEREAELCQRHPDLLERLQRETGLGMEATRFGGRVGSPVHSAVPPPQDGVVKRRHLTKMLSLDNLHDLQQFLAWLERVRRKATPGSNVTILTEPKLDGLSCSLRYERSFNDLVLTWAATRGDGTLGQDVTAAIQRVQDLPLILDAPGYDCDRLEVRGEIILPNAALASLRYGHNLSFANARNAASGILLRKEEENQGDDNRRTLQSLLRFYAYDLVTTGSDWGSGSASVRSQLQKWGFRTPQPTVESKLVVDADIPWSEGDVRGALEYYAELEKHRNGVKSSLAFDDYDMDGCVHKVTDPALRSVLGHSNRAPRWAMAHKFPATAVVTSLESIEIQVGRTGALTPVAVFGKVDLGGVSVQRATLHNFQHMRRTLGGGDCIPVGTKVFVRRAGDVIPQVVSLASRDALPNDSNGGCTISLLPPNKCPACGSPAIFDSPATRKEGSDDGDAIGQAIRCSGPPLLCEPRAVQALKHAYSRDALDIQGLSEARIRQLMNESLLTVPSDIFAIAADPHRLEQVAKLPGWGMKSAHALARSANQVASKGVELRRFIHSLGIRNVGLHLSALIAELYGSVDEFLKDLKHAGGSDEGDRFAQLTRLREESNMTKGIGPTVLAALDEFARDPVMLSAAISLASRISVTSVDSPTRTLTETVTDEEGAPLRGMTVVFTGALPGMTRSEAQAFARSMGAKSTPSSVTKSTSLLVRGMEEGASKKLADALKYGIRIMAADEFLAMGGRLV